MTRRWVLWSAAAVLLAASGCGDRGKAKAADGQLRFLGEKSFGRVPVHATRELQVSYLNVGRAQISIHEVWIEDQDGAYRATFEQSGPHMVVPGGTTDLKVRFTPRHDGDFPAALVARSDSFEEPLFTVRLAGQGVDARAKLNGRTLDFGGIELGSEKVKALRVENPGDVEIKVIPRLLGADADEFSTAAVTLGPHQFFDMTVRFAPTRVGQKRVAMAVAPCEGCVDEVVTLLAEGLDRAIVAEPAELDFGQVPLDQGPKLAVMLHNISTEPQDVMAWALDQGTDPGFTHQAGEAPVTLQGGDQVPFTFRFSPGHMSGATGGVTFGIASKRNPSLKVPLLGFGGAPEICVTPESFDFGDQPVGAKVGLTVNIRNCGSPNGNPLVITGLVMGASVTGQGGVDQFSVAPAQLPQTLLAGQGMNVRVFYEPTREGPAFGALGVRTTLFQGNVARVELQGNGTPHAPCNLTITPALVDFGTVPPLSEALLGIKIFNSGTDVCPVKNMKVSDDGGGVFHMPGGDLDGVIVYPGYGFSFMVQFLSPATGGTRTGSVQIVNWDPANPVIQVPLIANTQTSCLVATPSHLDFGFSRPDCPPPPQTTTLSNQCKTPVRVRQIEIGPGTTDGEFAIDAAPAVPLTLNPGDEAKVSIRYLAQIQGMNLSPLFVDAEGLDRPLLVPLLGESNPKGEQTDRFVQQDGTKVDVLFIVDNTGTMVEEHPRLVAAIPAFVNAAQSRGVDLHVGVTTTGIDPVSDACPGGAKGGEAGRLFPADNSNARILTSQTPNLAAELQQNVQVGQCAIIEQGLEAMRRALSSPLVDHADDPRTPLKNDGNLGLIRGSAALAVVIVGDEDDHSGDDVDSYVAFLRTVKGINQPQRSAIFALAPTSSGCATAGGAGTRYAEAALKTGGDVLSICAGDYSPLLVSVADRLFTPQDRFTLSHTPDGTGIEVVVNGVKQTSGWSYDAANNQVVFGTRPPAGATIEITYQRLCGT